MDQDQLNETSRIIIEAAIDVHSKLGPGLLENVYQTCTAYYLRKAGQVVLTEQKLPIRYGDVQIDAGYRIDLLVNDAVIVEVKSVEQLLPVHHAQVLSYLRLSQKRLGLLINFNVPRLLSGLKRIVNNF